VAGVGTTEKPKREMKRPTYKILEADSAELLTEAVNKALKEGWELAGGVAVTVSNVTENDRGERESNAFYFYYQAMSK
jgi:hypothetical protein